MSETDNKPAEEQLQGSQNIIATFSVHMGTENRLCHILKKTTDIGEDTWGLAWERFPKPGAYATMIIGEMRVGRPEDISCFVPEASRYIDIAGNDIDEIELIRSNQSPLRVTEADALGAIARAKIPPFEAAKQSHSQTVITWVEDRDDPQKRHILLFPPLNKSKLKLGGEYQFLAFTRQVLRDLVKQARLGTGRNYWIEARKWHHGPLQQGLRDLTGIRSTSDADLAAAIDNAISSNDMASLQKLASDMAKASRAYPPIRRYISERRQGRIASRQQQEQARAE